MDNDGVCKRFILVDDEYKFFFDHHLSGGDNNSFLPPFDDDNGESVTRNLSLDFSSGDSNRSKLGGGGTEKKPINSRVSQKRKRKEIGSEAEVSRARTRESIQRDNRAAERRKRKMAELESARVSRNQETIQRDNKGKKVSESTKVNTLKDVPLVRAQETIQRDNKARKVSESTKVDTLKDVPLARAIQRDNKGRKVPDSTKVNTLKDAPLVRAQETIQRDNKAKKMSESKVNTLREVPLFRTKEAIRRDNRITERRKKKIDETKAAGTTSRVVHVERVNRAVDKTPRFVPVTQSNKGVSVGNRKKSVVDKDYMSYLTWLVDSLKDSTTVPGPTPPTQNQSTMPPEKDTESCSDDDDDDMIMVSDSPFSGGDSTTPFVVSRSKTVIDLEKDSTEDESISSVFTKELMDELEKPYDEGELLRLSGDVSVKKQVSRCRELRKGRVSNYETHELGHSYLEKVSDFDREYRRVDGDDEARLKLLRGFFFYLKNVTRAGSFKPWLPENQKKL
ncbi:hypothetical protein Bca52824_021272 [Brassica carinata]|uniref:Uncharacterized protein n=1 Tax=Brassica carinata TaxID=52824 RepID=A0A8X7VWM8_BRACI|nr:hypothetical protein Bca52824_021272 [Brassica carinata]